MRIIRTNNVPRDLIDGSNLSPEEREQFDYLDWSRIDQGTESASFFRFKGDLYDLGTFERYGSDGWDGFHADSFFSGMLVRLVDDGERVIVALYFA